MDFTSLWPGLNDASDMSLRGKPSLCSLISPWFHGEGASEVRNFRRSVRLRRNVSLSLILDSEFTNSFNIKFSDCSWAMAGSTSTGMCLLVICSNFARYTSLSRTTVLLPLSAGIIIIKLSF